MQETAYQFIFVAAVNSSGTWGAFGMKSMKKGHYAGESIPVHLFTVSPPLLLPLQIAPPTTPTSSIKREK